MASSSRLASRAWPACRAISANCGCTRACCTSASSNNVRSAIIRVRSNTTIKGKRVTLSDHPRRSYRWHSSRGGLEVELNRELNDSVPQFVGSSTEVWILVFKRFRIEDQIQIALAVQEAPQGMVHEIVSGEPEL